MQIVPFSVPYLPLKDTNGGQLGDPLVVVSPCNISTAVSLEDGDHLSQFQVTLLLKMGQHSGSEENLWLSNSVEIRIHLKAVNLKYWECFS